MRRIVSFLITLCLLLSGLSVSAFELKESIPQDGSTLEFIQEITLIFDYEDLKTQNPTVTDWHIGCNVWGGDPVVALKNSNGDIVAQIIDNAELSEGDVFTFSFENPVILQPEEQYTLEISEYSFSLYKQGNYKGYVADNEAVSFVFYGKAGDVKILALDKVLPEERSVIADINKVDFYFNNQIDIKDGALSYLYETGLTEPIASARVELNEDGISASTVFDEVTLFNTHSYRIVIPENSIFLKGETENGYQEISVNYTGASYNYFGYGRISPSNNSEVEYLSRISVPVKLEAGAQYIGRDFKATACMYKVEGEERTLVADAIECNINEATNGFYINVFDFALEPSSTYQIEVEKDSFHLWSADTQKPLYDTSNETLTLTYTTPAEIAPLAVQEFGEVTPVASEPLEKLEAFKVMLAPYEFENTFYYPEFLSSAAEGYNVVSVVDVTDNSEVTSFKVDIKWDTDNNYWLENIEPLDVTLFEGRSYEVRVPAGMVCCRYDPIRELTANKDFAVTYNGGYSPNCEFTYSVSGLSDVTTTVAKGSTVTVNVAPAENFKVESVIFNGEEAALSGDSFTTPALDSDEALLEVTFAYDGTILFDFTTGVDDIADCPFKVWSNDDHIVIENVTVGADIKVYSVAGVLIADTTATDEVVNISVLPGVYVVVIDGVGLKVKH